MRVREAVRSREEGGSGWGGMMLYCRYNGLGYRLHDLVAFPVVKLRKSRAEYMSFGSGGIISSKAASR